MSLGLLLGQEQTGRLYYVLGTYLVPLQVCGVLLCGDADGVAVDNQQALLDVSLDGALELAVHRIVLEHVSQVVYRAEVVDADNLILVGLRAGSTENHTTDTTEAVDTNLNLRHSFLIYWLITENILYFPSAKLHTLAKLRK